MRHDELRVPKGFLQCETVAEAALNGHLDHLWEVPQYEACMAVEDEMGVRLTEYEWGSVPG